MYVEIEILTVEVVKSSNFHDITLCSQLTFWRNMLPPSSGSKNKPSKKTVLKKVASIVHDIISQKTNSLLLKPFSSYMYFSNSADDGAVAIIQNQ
jgi:hypothetical protein